MKISIIVPVYNVKKYLPKCIESLTSQTYNNLEIILVDDGSTDGSAEICNEYATSDGRIRVIHKDNGGLSDARNIGINSANGDYFMLVDSDDYVEKNAVERFVHIAGKENPDIIVGDFYKVDDRNRYLNTHTGMKEGEIYSSKEYIVSAVSKGEFHAEQWANFYRMDFWKKNNLRYKKGILHEDMEIVLKEFLLAEKISYLHYPFYYYVVRKGSIMNGDKRNKRLHDISKIYVEWKKTAEQQNNIELRKSIQALLAKCLIHSYAELGVCHPKYRILSKKELLEYAGSNVDRFKTLIYIISPKLYINMYRKKAG